MRMLAMDAQDTIEYQRQHGEHHQLVAEGH